MRTLPYQKTSFTDLLRECWPVIFFAFLLAFGVLTMAYVTSLARLNTLKEEKGSLAETNQKLREVLLQISPASLPEEPTIGLQEQDLRKDSGTLTGIFKVESGVFYGIVYKDRVTGSIPVWFFGTGEPPKRGSTVSFLPHYIRFKGGTEVLAFSKLEPNL